MKRSNLSLDWFIAKK